eukprot:scaffold5306_cov67-Cyclotella_meneghiniana.AAC.15
MGQRTACLRLPPNNLTLTVSRLPAYDCSRMREMRRLPACRLRLSRQLASPAPDYVSGGLGSCLGGDSRPLSRAYHTHTTLIRITIHPFRQGAY